MHRRKSSKDLDVDPSLTPDSTPSSTGPQSNGLTMNGFGSSTSKSVNGWGHASQAASRGSEDSSQPAPHRAPPPSAGPYRTSFNAPPSPTNGHTPPVSASPYVRNFSVPPQPGLAPNRAHSRARSVSGFAPASPSPLAASFSMDSVPRPPSAGPSHNRTRSTIITNGLQPSGSSNFPPSATAPSLLQSQTPTSPEAPSFIPSSPLSRGPTSPTQHRMPPPPSQVGRPVASRHSRLHSRNLSIYFPRPGSLPQHAIAEDGAQELVFGDDEPPSPAAPAPETVIPSADAGVSTSPTRPRRLGEGFTFGGRPPPDASASAEAGSEPLPPAQRAQRRGHHHKHSMSHNFFSFLEPGGGAARDELTTAPTPEPKSPWNPISPFTPALRTDDTGGVTGGAFEKMQSITSPGAANGFDADEARPKHVFQRAPAPARAGALAPRRFSWTSSPVIAGAAQFVLGASVWLSGQRAGSLALTGLGYWVVFDAFGIGVGSVLPGYLAVRRRRAEARGQRSAVMYGNARVEALALFAQAVYLLFTAVYVCKETFEHLLLSFGQEGREGHHHHSGDEASGIVGINYPVVQLTITLLALLSTALGFGVHSRMVDVAGNQLQLSALLEGLPFRRAPVGVKRRYVPLHGPDGDLALGPLANPYVVAPVGFAVALLGTKLFLPPSLHVRADLVLAFALAGTTFALAYPAAAALGTVLLQTAPPRGAPDGAMESFLRAMREIERHPAVLHLPAPHVWALAPGAGAPLVATLELHVARDMDDASVLDLTRWAGDRVSAALRNGRRVREGEQLEVTVGVVRG